MSNYFLFYCIFRVNTFINVTIFTIFILCVSGNASAWGPLTHMSLAIDAIDKSDYKLNDELMGAYLAGAVEADLGCSVGGDSDESDNMYHDPAFVEAMIHVANKKKSPEKDFMLARALGYFSHLSADEIAHNGRGYPNAKKIFDKKDAPDHGAVEVCVDVLRYKKEGYDAKIGKYTVNYMDLSTLIELRNEFARIKGIEIKNDAVKLQKSITQLQAFINTEQNSISQNISKEKIDEMDEYFSDRYSGCNGVNGLNLSLQKINENFKNPLALSNNIKKSDFTQIDNSASGGNIYKTIAGFTKKIFDGAGRFISSTIGSLFGYEKTNDLITKFLNDRVFKPESDMDILGNFIMGLVSADCKTFKDCFKTSDVKDSVADSLKIDAKNARRASSDVKISDIINGNNSINNGSNEAVRNAREKMLAAYESYKNSNDDENGQKFLEYKLRCEEYQAAGGGNEN